MKKSVLLALVSWGGRERVVRFVTVVKRRGRD